MTTTPPTLRGWHKTRTGRLVTLYATNGEVRLCVEGVDALLTPEQAEKLARDLRAYAEAARRRA